MAKVRRIRPFAIEPVYNMTVAKHHNFLIKGNLILKNCDMLRYFCISRTLPGEVPVEPVHPDEFDDADLEEEMTGGEVTVGYINA